MTEIIITQMDQVIEVTGDENLIEIYPNLSPVTQDYRDEALGYLASAEAARDAAAVSAAAAGLSETAAAASAVASDASADASAASLADMISGQIRAFLRPTNSYKAQIIVDRGAGTVAFPPMALVTPSTTIIISSGDTFTTLALSVTPGSRIFYYVDLADSTIKSSTSSAFGRIGATWVPLGYSENHSFQTLHGHPIRFATEAAQNVRVTARPNSATGLGSDAILVDRVRQVVGFPSMLVWRSFDVSAWTISPVGWPATARTEFALSTAYGVTVYYYLNIGTLTLGSTTVWNSPLQSDNVVYIGSSHMGSFTSRHGLRVDYVQTDAPARGSMSPEGVARASQAGSVQTQYGSRVTYLHSGTKSHAIQPAFPNDIMRSSGTGTIDLSYFPSGTSLKVRTYGNVTTLFAGRGRTFLGTSDNQCTFPANSAFEVVSSYADIFLVPIIGAATYSTVAEPVMDRSILLAGQSQRVIYGTSGGIGGFMRGLRNSAWLQAAIDTSINWIAGATGGTAIDKRSTSGGSTAYWWDHTLNAGLGGPGPALDACVAAMVASAAAGQPAPTWVFWALGESDAVALDSGALTVAQATESLGKVWDYIRANGATGAEFLISPIGANDFTVTKGFAGSRSAVLDAITSKSSYAYLGAEYYDSPRMMGEVHLHDMGYAAWGFREARAWANYEYGQTNDLGPTFTSATLSANKRSVTIDYSKSGPLYVPYGTQSYGVVAGAQPFGFGIIPAGQPATAAPVAALRGYYSGASLVLDTDYDLTGCTLVYPYGSFPEHRQSQFIRDYQADEFHGVPGLPMRSFVSSPLA